MDQRAGDTVESTKEWAAPELTKIDVEECTSQLFLLGDEDAGIG